MATKGVGYVVVYISIVDYRLAMEKDQSFSAKVWNFGTTFLNS